ncbi:MAG: tetratricopeptide repeat protein, partial [Muribaculaceae bacterium]|nr:tetratricopeptide repeat protein [Muribaculaceae bacterium]
MTLQELKEKTSTLDADEAIALITEYIESNPSDPEALTLRGMRHFGAGHRAQAIGDYLEALRIDPGNKNATQALQFANSIL